MDGRQVRHSPRLIALRRWLLPAAISAAALLVYCSAAPREASSPRPAPFRSPPLAQTASAHGPSPAPSPLSLETLTPLLARPGFESVLAALEAGDQRRALGELDAALAKSPAPPELSVAFAFVRARLLEQSGDAQSALSEYERARAADWPLAPDAELGAARALLGLGRAAEALAKVERVVGSRSLERQKLLLSADAALLTGDRTRAFAAFRGYLAARPVPGENQVALRFASELLSPRGSSGASALDAIEALDLARRVGRQAAGDSGLERSAEQLASRALSLIPEPERASHARETPEQNLERLDLLVDARRFEDAQKAADALLSGMTESERFAKVGCETQQLRAKSLAGQREWGNAVDSLGDVIRRCTADPDLHARALFLAGRYAASDKRHAQAVKYFGELESAHPSHTLADDARLYAALSYLELGSEARFTELLQRMPEDYAQGDMVVEGVFRLAVRRMDKADWSGAARILERALGLLKDGDAARGQELAGRERYFLARAELVLGRREQGLAALEEVVKSFPLSYYMLWANSRLQQLAPERAARCLSETLARGGAEPFA
ncbi:MAG TPA: tetratricopeptide repeat protein, partial [Polyangiaceae bacterium]|nr:tetratricopeptide repeat protein [Polyangiaceae bacterium]